MTDISTTIEETVRRERMIEKGNSVCVAVSGGPDSIALLHLIYGLREKYGIVLSVVHVNHGLRGTESDKDEEFVRTLAEKFSIPCFSYRVDVKKFKNVIGGSTQGAARELRYLVFKKMLKSGSVDRIALAHTADDATETTLMNIIRGAGLHGIAGIPPVRGGNMIRPLIDVWKKDILAHLSLNSIHFRVDRSNEERYYMRNRVRLELIPYLEKNYNPAVTASLKRTASLISDTARYISAVALRELEKCKIFEGRHGMEFDSAKFLLLDPVLQREVLIAIIGSFGGGERSAGYDHIETARKFIASGSPGEVHIPGMVCANSSGKFLFKLKGERAAMYSYPFAPGELELPEAGCVVRVEEVSRNKVVFDNSCREVFLDADSIPEGTVFRNRREGDTVRPLGSGGSQKLKKFFINSGVTRWKRETLPLLVSGSNILWIPGWRISEDVKLKDATKRIFKMEYIRLEND